ncbi:MAG TPA: 6-phosphogluconolactonase [Deinococcales bacterium]|nr:6-phosphogluconolactonase [Deinococcales bacterium]
MNHEVQVLDTREALAGRAAAEIEAAAARSVGQHETFSLAVPGGSTPVATFGLLAASAAFPWPQTILGLTDERLVPPEDERSNHSLVRRALLDPLAARGLAPRRVVPLPHEDGPDVAAQAEAVLDDALGASPFDLLVLGLGPDGHVASVFPATPPTPSSRRAVRTTPTPGLNPQVARVSLSMPEIARAARRIVLVQGEDKAAIVRRVLADIESEADLPGANLPKPGTLWLLDRAAASGLG